MMHEVVLCADEESLRNPSMLGLDGESLEDQQWLLPLSSACEAREYVREGGEAEEVWVASSDEVDPINLAATLKQDCAEMKVCLLAWQGSGSLMSRASAAGIDEVLGYPEMAQRYASMKSLWKRENPRRRSVGNPRGSAPVRERSAHSAGAPAHAMPKAGKLPRSSAGYILGAYGEDEPGVKEPDEVQLPDDKDSGAKHAAAERGVKSAKRGFVLCVVSASGGTGKSTISALSALIAANHGYATVIIDADLQFGDVASMFGEVAPLRVDEVIADPDLLDDAALHTGTLSVIAAPERIEQSELFLPQMPGLIDRARESFDVVVVNTGSFWTESHVQMMEASTNTLFLMDQRPTSVKAVRKALELCARCGVAAHPFLFAVNRCTRKSLLSSIDISCALNGVAVAELKEGGASVAELMSAGLAQQLVDDHNDLCVSLNDYLGRIIPAALGGPVPVPGATGDARGKSKPKSKRKGFKKRGKAACL